MELSMPQVEVSRTIVFAAPPHPGVLRGAGHRQPRPRPPRHRRDRLRPAGSSTVSSAPPAARSRPRSSPGAPRSPLTPSTGIPGSSSTSKTAARCASRPSSTHPPTCGSAAACTAWANSRTPGVRSTTGCCTLNVPARAASLRIQSSSGSRTRPSTRTGGELQPCALATLGSRPWPAPMRHRVRRHRHHQQEPARPDDRTARRPLFDGPGLLRPGPAAPQRAHHPPPARQHLRPHPRRPGFAIFYTKVHDRVLAPLFAAGQPQAPPSSAPP